MPRSVEVQLYDDDMNGMLGNLWEKFYTVKRNGPDIVLSAQCHRCCHQTCDWTVVYT